MQGGKLAQVLFLMETFESAGEKPWIGPRSDENSGAAERCHDADLTVSNCKGNRCRKGQSA